MEVDEYTLFMEIIQKLDNIQEKLGIEHEGPKYKLASKNEE